MDPRGAAVIPFGRYNECGYVTPFGGKEMDKFVPICKIDEYYMSRALSLASRGQGETSPNPMVGCVIVRDGHVIGEGYHERCGSGHAEIEALEDLARRGATARGATVYVNLEPCSHFGRTPPCAPRLVEEGVARVVVGMADPNPKVNQRGLEILRSGGIEVDGSCLESECRWLNRGFIRVQTLGRPWVTLKAAAGLDGRMALENGESRWITSCEARQWAHRMRAAHDAVLVGVGTVIRDDPELTVRDTEGRNPRRIVLDSRLATPVSAKVLSGEGGCLIFTCCGDSARAKALTDAGARVLRAPQRGGRVDLDAVLSELVSEGILSLMVEGGAKVLTAFMERGLADGAALFSSCRVMGEGPGIGTGLRLEAMSESLLLKDATVRRVGPDFLTEAFFSCSPGL